MELAFDRITHRPTAVVRSLWTCESDFGLPLVQKLRRAMPSHTFARPLHGGIDVRLAFILSNGHGRAVFFAFGVDASAAPITSRQQECCKNGRDAEDDSHGLMVSWSRPHGSARHSRSGARSTDLRRGEARSIAIRVSARQPCRHCHRRQCWLSHRDKRHANCWIDHVFTNHACRPHL